MLVISKAVKAKSHEASVEISRQAADGKFSLVLATWIPPSLGLVSNQPKIRLKRLKPEQNHLDSFKSPKGVGVNLKQLKVEYVQSRSEAGESEPW